MADQSAAVFNFQKRETQAFTHFIHFFKLENIEKSFKDQILVKMEGLVFHWEENDH